MPSAYGGSALVRELCECENERGREIDRRLVADEVVRAILVEERVRRPRRVGIALQRRRKLALDERVEAGGPAWNRARNGHVCRLPERVMYVLRRDRPCADEEAEAKRICAEHPVNLALRDDVAPRGLVEAARSETGGGGAERFGDRAIADVRHRVSERRARAQRSLRRGRERRGE